MGAFFFSENWIKANTAITKNVDYQELTPFISVAQEQIILPRIGKSLYDRLLLSIENKDYNTDELELIKLIRPASAYHTVYIAFPFLQTKIRNAGLVKNGDVTIQTITLKEMENLRSEFNQMTGFYMNKLNDWLCLYSSRFPEYSSTDPLNNKETVNPWDFGGFIPFKGTSGDELIKKVIGYNKI
jgi:hypothetical protein